MCKVLFNINAWQIEKKWIELLCCFWDNLILYCYRINTLNTSQRFNCVGTWCRTLKSSRPEIVLVLMCRGRVFLGRSELFQEVLWNVWVEDLIQLESWSQVVSSTPIWHSTERTPSSFHSSLVLIGLLRIVRNPLGDINAWWMSQTLPRSFCPIRSCRNADNTLRRLAIVPFPCCTRMPSFPPVRLS